ncbi:MAG: hypothetical protein IBX62_01630 [Coriobacteriia bacterium]|nr:hypothetical protein [Coriobacteriia bacterium]
MTDELLRARFAPAAVAALLAVALLMQTPAAVLSASASAGGDAVGRAGWAYMTGLRRFAAAVLWNRMEPLFHEYYEYRPLAEQTHLLPTTWMVVTLDPQFEEAYYVTGYLLSKRGRAQEGLELAEAGVRENPRSGTMRANYAQLLLFAGRRDRAVEQADEALAIGTWRDEEWRYEGYAVMRDIYRHAGLEERAERLQAELDRIAEEHPEAAAPEAHDHDGDGVPDH